MRLHISIATKDNIHQAKFALQVKKDVLPLYEEVFDVPFPLPKLDTLVVSISTSFWYMTVKSLQGKRLRRR